MEGNSQNLSQTPPPLTLGQSVVIPLSDGPGTSTAGVPTDATSPQRPSDLDAMNKKIESLANGQSQFQEQMMMWFQTTQMATAMANATAAARPATEKSAEDSKALPFLNLRLKEVEDIDFWKRDSSSNKHRYVAMLNVAKKLNKFQEKYLPQDTQEPEKAEAWNGAMAAVRNELENILIAEKSEFGWLTVKELSSDPVTRDEAKLKQIRSIEISLAKKKKDTKAAAEPKQPFRPQGVKRPHPDSGVAGPVNQPAYPPQYAMGFMASPYGQFGQHYGAPGFDPRFYGGFGMQQRFPAFNRPAIRTCFHCEKPGHFAYACPEKKK